LLSYKKAAISGYIKAINNHDAYSVILNIQLLVLMVCRFEQFIGKIVWIKRLAVLIVCFL